MMEATRNRSVWALQQARRQIELALDDLERTPLESTFEIVQVSRVSAALQDALAASKESIRTLKGYERATRPPLPRPRDGDGPVPRAEVGGPMNVVISIFGHASDAVGEREHVIPEGTAGLIVAALEDAGITVDDVHADLVEEDEVGL